MEAGDQDLAIAGIREQMALRTSLAKGIALSWSEIRAAMDAAHLTGKCSSGLTPTNRTRNIEPIHQVIMCCGSTFSAKGPACAGLFRLGRTTRIS